MARSTVYLIGAGPGDPGLITVKALELIREADCIVYDYLANVRFLESAKDNCEVIYVGKKAGKHTLPQEKINRLLARLAKKHNIVVRLKGGDPFIFGRGAEEALYLKKKKIDIEIVPGITSAIAVPAYAGIPLTHRTETSTVGFVTGHEDPTKGKSNIDWDALVNGLGTIVFLMGVGNLDSITKKLISCGKPKSTPVAVIRWGTTSRQRTVTGTLVDIADIVRKNKITPPSIIVVGGVTGIRKQLNWFEQKPLFGKRIIVTRTRRQAGVLSEKLIAQGSDVIEVPTIDIVPLKADAKVKKAFSQNKYDWVFFTSQNGVKEFYELLDRAKKDSRIFAGAKICAIGSETAKSLAVMGIRADYVPGKFRSEAIVEHFNKKNISGKKVLILRAKKARNILPEGLKKNGALVTAVDLYDTRSPKGGAGKLKDILKEKVDMVTFASSSTVENFIKLAGDDYSRLLKGVKIASIGPITSKAIRKFGLKVNIEAKTYTIPELVKAIVSNEGKGKKDKG